MEDLKAANTPLVGFSGRMVFPKGKITLFAHIGLVETMTEFLVVDVESAYNTIIGRTWLQKMRPIHSTYHQVLRFPINDGIIDVWGDQVSLRTYFLALVKGKGGVEVQEDVTTQETRK